MGRPVAAGAVHAAGLAPVLACVLAALALAGPATALTPETLRGQLVLVTKGGLKDTPDKLVDEISDHIRALVSGVAIANVLKSADGRIIFEIVFPAERKLAFEKMVAELPAVNFMVPVTVEGWNVRSALDSAAPGDTRSEEPHSAFDMTIGAKRDVISSLNFKDVPLRDVLSYLGQQMDLEYICPGDVGRKLVTAQLRAVTLPAFLEGLKLSLDIGIRKVGPFYVFSPHLDSGPHKGAASRATDSAR